MHGIKNTNSRFLAVGDQCGKHIRSTENKDSPLALSRS